MTRPMPDNAAADRALVLFSGGQDSATCLAWALDRYAHVETVGFAYGQRHKIELDCRAPLRAALQAVPTSAWDRILSLAPQALRQAQPGDKLHKLAALLDMREAELEEKFTPRYAAPAAQVPAVPKARKPFAVHEPPLPTTFSRPAHRKMMPMTIRPQATARGYQVGVAVLRMWRTPLVPDAAVAVDLLVHPHVECAPQRAPRGISQRAADDSPVDPASRRRVVVASRRRLPQRFRSLRTKRKVPIDSIVTVRMAMSAVVQAGSASTAGLGYP